MDIYGGSLLIGVSAFRLYTVCPSSLILLSPSHVLSEFLAIYLHRQCIARRCDWLRV